RDELGVEVLDVRLRRYCPPVEVRPAVFDLIRSERRQVAATLRAEGEAEYQTLTSQAERERDAILAQADAEAERIRGRGEAKATVVLSSSSPLLKLLTQGPPDDLLKAPASLPAPSTAASAAESPQVEGQP